MSGIDLTFVDFEITFGGTQYQSWNDTDGKICYDVPHATYFEVIANKDGYVFASRNGTINDDTDWVLALNPIVSTLESGINVPTGINIPMG